MERKRQEVTGKTSPEVPISNRNMVEKNRPKELREGLVEDGRYRFVRKLGEGGIGEVWLVDDLSTCYMEDEREVCSQVAVKSISSKKYPLESDKLRFEREAKMMVESDNNFIVRFFDTYRNDSGDFRIVMEYIGEDSEYSELNKKEPEGLEKIGHPPSNLEHILDEDVTDLSQDNREQLAAAVGLQVAIALEYMLERGIIHRDIKPENMFVVSGVFSHFPLVKVADFGLSKYIPLAVDNEDLNNGDKVPASGNISHLKDSGEIIAKADTSPMVTQPGFVTGTPRYMSPESYLDGYTSTSKEDLYSLAIVLYQIVSGGKYPFSGTTSLDLFISKKSNDYVSLQELRGNKMPTKLEQLIMACMEGNESLRGKINIVKGEWLRPVESPPYNEGVDEELLSVNTPTDLIRVLYRIMKEDYPSVLKQDPFAVFFKRVEEAGGVT